MNQEYPSFPLRVFSETVELYVLSLQRHCEHLRKEIAALEKKNYAERALIMAKLSDYILEHNGHVYEAIKEIERKHNISVEYCSYSSLIVHDSDLYFISLK